MYVNDETREQVVNEPFFSSAADGGSRCSAVKDGWVGEWVFTLKTAIAPNQTSSHTQTEPRQPVLTGF